MEVGLKRTLGLHPGRAEGNRIPNTKRIVRSSVTSSLLAKQNGKAIAGDHTVGARHLGNSSTTELQMGKEAEVCVIGVFSGPEGHAGLCDHRLAERTPLYGS